MSDVNKTASTGQQTQRGTICTDTLILKCFKLQTKKHLNQAQTSPGHISASRLCSTMNTCIFLSAVKIPYPLSLSVLIYSLYVSDEILNKCFLIAAQVWFWWRVASTVSSTEPISTMLQGCESRDQYNIPRPRPPQSPPPSPRPGTLVWSKWWNLKASSVLNCKAMTDSTLEGWASENSSTVNGDQLKRHKKYWYTSKCWIIAGRCTFTWLYW